MSGRRALLSALSVTTLASAAWAQGAGGFLIETTGPVTPSRPWTVIWIHAWFDHEPGVAELFTHSQLDLVIEDLEGEFAGAACYPHIHYCAGCGGLSWPGRIDNLCVGQIHAPHVGIYGMSDNPLLVFRIVWETSDLTPRELTISAENVETFWVSPYETSSVKDLIVSGGYMESSGTITVLDFDPCPADCDMSGALDFFDFLCFQNWFAAGDPRADCDFSGKLEFLDFLCFQNAFVSGCP